MKVARAGFDRGSFSGNVWIGAERIDIRRDRREDLRLQRGIGGEYSIEIGIERLCGAFGGGAGGRQSGELCFFGGGQNVRHGAAGVEFDRFQSSHHGFCLGVTVGRCRDVLGQRVLRTLESDLLLAGGADQTAVSGLLGRERIVGVGKISAQTLQVIDPGIVALMRDRQKFVGKVFSQASGRMGNRGAGQKGGTVSFQGRERRRRDCGAVHLPLGGLDLHCGDARQSTCDPRGRSRQGRRG